MSDTQDYENDRRSVDRRQDLAVKVATLEERSIANREKFESFEHTFLLHARSEEIVMTELVENVTSLEGKLDAKLETKLEPIHTKVEAHEKALTRFTTIIGTLSLVATVSWAILEYLKEPISKWLTK